MVARKIKTAWQAGRFATGDSIIATWALVVIGVWRGLDYIAGDGVTAPALSAVEALAPLPVWGALVLAGCALLVGSMLARWHLGVWLGYAWLATFYVGLLLGILLAIGSWSLLVLATGTAAVLVLAWRGSRSLMGRWRAGGYAAVVLVGVGLSIALDPLRDGLRGVGPLAFVLFMHLLLALRTGPRPIEAAGRDFAVESVVAPRAEGD